MTDKFTLRDILVYSIVGLTSLVFYFLHNQSSFESLIVQTKDYSDLTVLVLIPISYLFGHLVFGIDDIIFNYLLYKPLKDGNLATKGKFLKAYNYIFFGNRNLGFRNALNINNDKFLETCAKLLNDGKYAKAEYYQILSDLFKGIYLIVFFSFLIFLYNLDEITPLSFSNDSFKYSILYLILLVVVWYRGRIFSAYYVKYIEREII